MLFLIVFWTLWKIGIYFFVNRCVNRRHRQLNSDQNFTAIAFSSFTSGTCLAYVLSRENWSDAVERVRIITKQITNKKTSFLQEWYFPIGLSDVVHGANKCIEHTEEIKWWFNFQTRNEELEILIAISSEISIFLHRGKLNSKLPSKKIIWT